MFYNDFFVIFNIFVFAFIQFTNGYKLPLVESCTEKVKAYFLKNNETQDDYRALLDDGGDAVGFQVQIVNDVCNNTEIPEALDFFNKNAKVISELTDFTRTLNDKDLAQFLALEKNNEFAKQIEFIKDKYDSANAKNKNKLKTLMHNLVPLLLRNLNANDAVISYFNSVTPNELVKILDIAEKHNVTALKNYVLGTFDELNLNAKERSSVGQFIDSIHNVKNAAVSAAATNNKKHKSKSNAETDD